MIADASPETAMRMLIAIEPRAYSQTIGYTIQALRPRYMVRTVDPDLLGAEIECCAPNLVLCSLPRPVALDEGLAWVEFRPYARPREQLSVNDRHLGLERWRLRICCPSSTRRSPRSAALEPETEPSPLTQHAARCVSALRITRYIFLRIAGG